MAIQEASATDSPTTTSGTDVLLTGMSITPGAGDYLAFFSTAIQLSAGNHSTFVSFYVNSVQIGHTERELFHDGSVSNKGPFFHCTCADLTVGAGEAVEIKWRRVSSGTATASERTLILFPVDSGDIDNRASAVGTTLDSATWTLLTGMQFANRAAGKYLILFSASAFAPSGAVIEFGVYAGGSLIAHTARRQFAESSIANMDFIFMIAAVVDIGSTQDVEIRWRRRSGSGTLTCNQRTVALYSTDELNEASVATSTTTTSTSYVLANGMTLTPGADTYVGYFSTSSENADAGGDYDIFNILDAPSQIAHTERATVHENSTPATAEPLGTGGVIDSLGGGETAEAHWKTEGSTATFYERTLVLLNEAAAPPAGIASHRQLIGVGQGTR